MKRYPSCILSTCCVPWDEEGKFMEEIFRHEVRNMLKKGTKHLYLFGTAGEGYAVTDRQFDQIVRVFVDVMRGGGAEPMVGVMGMSLGMVIERIGRARDMGVRQFQISLPNWGALAERELFSFFRETCGRFLDCQFLHYNLMRTKRLVSASEYAQLAEKHPNFVATKNSTDAMGRIEELLLRAPQLQHFLNETGYAHGSQFAECGLLGSEVVLNWRSGQAFFAAGQNRDIGTLHQMVQEMNGLVRDLIEIAAGKVHMDGAFDKVFCRLHDPRFPLRLLPPYEGFSDADFERFASMLRQKYPRWTPGVA